MFKQGLPNTMTYEYGMEYCWKDKRRLCSSVEICPVSPSRKVPVGGVINGDHWVPVSDKYNEWIQIGKDKCTDVLLLLL